MKSSFMKLGFTMIELLVVISVIGVLAVAVLSSINPIEQINKSRDVRAQSDAAQLISAIDRYYAGKEKYPWNEDGYCINVTNGTCDADDIAVASGFPYVDGTDTSVGTNTHNACKTISSTFTGMCTITNDTKNWLDALVDVNEVKTSFVSRLKSTAGGAYQMYINKIKGASATISVCFKPSSNSFMKDAFDTCKAATAATSWPAGLPKNACKSTYTSPFNATTNSSDLLCMPFGKLTTAGGTPAP